MRILAVLLFILFGRFAHAQYGQEGAILAVGEGVARALELDQLNKIAEMQNDIVAYQGTIVLATADIVRVDQALLDSQKNVSGWLSDLSSVITITTKAEALGQMSAIIIDLAAEQPDYLPFVTESMLNIILDATVIVEDFSIALKESDTNLLSPKKRMDILNISKDGLDHLIGKTSKLYYFMVSLKHILDLDIDLAPMTYDFNQVILANDLYMDSLIQN